MHLLREKAFLLVLASAIACHSPTGPVSARFVLENINGRSLPTYLASTPGPTTTIFSASLTLDKSGTVVMTEHRRDLLRGEGTYTDTLEYRIHGIQIEIGCFKPHIGTDMCPNLTGTILGGILHLNVGRQASTAIIYTYRA
jgi:hypothetical protein